ncbi:MAG TPA: DUF4129 domain-containing protein [Ktedonobacteraceae bacterium]|nr:DUF4129 domain-containing protein [Ktedonobacteraceae bacterium]
MQVEAPRASNRVECFALPIATSVMEAQPLALIVAVLTLLFTHKLADMPLGVAEIALLELGLLWWAMFVESRIRRAGGNRKLARLHLPGWLLALAVTVGPLVPSLIHAEAIFAAFVDVAVVTWLWRRDMYYVQIGFEYGSLSASFKVGFGVLLAVLLLIIALPPLPSLRDALASALPVFFLGGLVTLSLARLGTIRHNRRAPAGSQADPTRSWLFGLALFGALLTVLVLVLESIFSLSSFELALSALAPLWNALGTLLGWILYGIIFLILSPIYYLASWLIGLLTHHGTATQPPPKIGLPRPPFQQQGSAQPIPPEVFTIGRWVLLLLAFVALLLLVRAALRRWFMRFDREGVEEVREGLDARSLLGERWHEWWNRRRRRTEQEEMLEPLDPTSARARYRELLHTVAAAKEQLARMPAETPTEYEQRLLVYLEANPVTSQNASHVAGETDSQLLRELTHAYILERYGGRQSDEYRRTQMPVWVARLVARLTGRAPVERTTQRASKHVRL